MQADPVERSAVQDLLPVPPPMDPSDVVFRQPVVRYAGWWRRVGAAVIDYLIVGVAFMIASGFLGASAGSPVVAFFVFLFVLGGISAYFILLNAKGEATIGKRVLGIRLQLEDGGDLGVGIAALRFLASPLSWMWFLGILWPLWDEKKQTFHDKIALTIVVKS